MLTESLSSPSGIQARTVRRLASAVGRLRIASFVRLAAARWQAARARDALAPAPARVRELYRRALHTAFHDAIEIADLAIDGDDLRRLGVQPGPQYRPLLALLLDGVLDDPATNTAEALADRVPALLASL